MIATTITLNAGAPAKIIVTGGVGSRSVMIRTALTDVSFGNSTALTATGGYVLGAAVTNIVVPVGNDDLYAFSTAGGAIYVLYPENA